MASAGGATAAAAAAAAAEEEEAEEDIVGEPAQPPAAAAEPAVARLARAWRNEKAAPEILRYDADVVARLRLQLQAQEEVMATLAGDPARELELKMYRLDADRAQFLLRSYLRTRLLKIERHNLSVLADATAHDRLSDDEKLYTEGYAKVVQKHLEGAVLDRMPDKYKTMLKQSETSERHDMIVEPPVDDFVVCRIKEHIGQVELDSVEEESIDLAQDDLFILRYRPVRALLAAGKIELI